MYDPITDKKLDEIKERISVIEEILAEILSHYVDTQDDLIPLLTRFAKFLEENDFYKRIETKELNEKPTSKKKGK